MTITTASVVRLALLGLLGGILQLSAVSQITVFGVPADLSPLLVASVGFIAGSIPGAVFGFCLGLFIDISLFQTLGVSSLVFTAVGYGAGPHPRAARPGARPRAGRGRRRGDRDRRDRLRAAAVPARRRRRRSRCCCCARSLMTIVLNTLLALPVYALMRRALLPFLPDDPRRRRRRAYTTGGLSPISRA